MHLATKFHHLTFNCSDVIVLTNTQSHKQTLLKTSNYAAPMEKWLINTPVFSTKQTSPLKTIYHTFIMNVDSEQWTFHNSNCCQNASQKFGSGTNTWQGSTKCKKCIVIHTHTHTHTTVLLLCWNLSGTTRVSTYQKGKTRQVKTNLDLLEQETVSGSGICWAICKSAPHPRQPHQHPTTQFFTGRMPFLPPNQQCKVHCSMYTYKLAAWICDI